MNFRLTPPADPLPSLVSCQAGQVLFTPRLIALDIDGTLVNHDDQLSSRVHDAVRRVLDAGLPIVLSTGRSWLATQDIVERLELPPGFAVMSNGAVVAQHQPLHVIEQVTFDPRQVIERTLELHPEALIGIEKFGVGYRMNRPFPEGELTGDVIIETPEQLASELATRVIIRDPSASPADFERLADSLGLHGVEYFVGWTAWLDIAPLGVNKATGLATVCERLGVSATEVLAIGDGNNDIEMLRWAGFGVAMGQSPLAVREVADAVTASVDADGVADVLDQLLGRSESISA